MGVFGYSTGGLLKHIEHEHHQPAENPVGGKKADVTAPQSSKKAHLTCPSKLVDYNSPKALKEE